MKSKALKINSREERTKLLGKNKVRKLAVETDDHGFGILCYRPYALFVMGVVTLAQFSNQMCRFLIITTSAEMQKDQHWGPGDGSGAEYSILIGPAFIVVFTCSSIPISMWAETKHRPRMLALFSAGWLATTALTSLTKTYWQLILTRVLLAISQAACSAICISLLTDYFPKHFRSTAVSVFNLGIYLGYSITLGLGNAVTHRYNWQLAHLVISLMGVPGFLLLFCVKNPVRGAMVEFDEIAIQPFDDINLRMTTDRIKAIVKTKDRKWFFRTYRKCFLGSDLIDTILEIGFVNTREEGVEFAKKMYRHGYLYHVTKDHPFKDSNLFYRFTVDLELNANLSVVDAAPAQRLEKKASVRPELLIAFRGLLDIKHRRYHGRVYKNCFIGKDTVTKMVDSGLVSNRKEAINIGNRVMQEGHFRHVLNHHIFKDKAYFYRLIPLTKDVSQIHIESTTMWSQFRATVQYFMRDPANWTLILAGALRYGAGYIWGQYSSLYYEIEKGQSKNEVAAYLGWIPAVGGILGTLVGGVVADLAVAKLGVWARLGVVISSNLIATPFAFFSLMLPIPWAYFALIPGYMASEMWMGVTLVVVTEVSPLNLRATVVAVYLFFISIIGGNMTSMVEPIRNQFDLTLEITLSILFPGLYIISGILFTISMLLLRKRHVSKQSREELRPVQNFRGADSPSATPRSLRQNDSSRMFSKNSESLSDDSVTFGGLSRSGTSIMDSNSSEDSLHSTL